MSKHALSPAGQLSGICEFFRKRYKCPTVGPGTSYKNSMVGLKKVCKFLACEQTSSILQISQKKSGEKMSVNRCRLPCSAKHLHKSFFLFFSLTVKKVLTNNTTLDSFRARTLFFMLSDVLNLYSYALTGISS